MPTRSRTDRVLTMVDLFCGAGGFSEGFRQAGWSPIVGSDIDPDALATYVANFPEAHGYCGDLREAQIRELIVDSSEAADVVVGGPPCQGFSQVRSHDRLIDDPRNSLYREFVRVLSRLSPRAFVMENVPGVAQLRASRQVIDDLSCGGAYAVAVAEIDAVAFGVPQSRRRLIFLGLHRDLGVEVPNLGDLDGLARIGLQRVEGEYVRYEVRSATGRTDLLERLADDWDDGLVTAEQALGDLVGLEGNSNRIDELPVSGLLPQPRSAYQKAMREGLGDTITNVSVPRMNADTKLRLAGIPPGGNHLDLDEHLQGRYLSGEKWGPHNGSQRLSRRHYYAYRRLHPDLWSWTLNTKADSVYHWSTERSLSVREFARLQSFPDSFTFTTDPRKGELAGRVTGGPAHSRYRQVGNAIPPLLARSVADLLRSIIE